MKIARITIAGAGTMGYSMAEIFARFGYQVILWNHRQATLDKAKTKIAPEAADKITYTTDKAAFADCDLIVENIVEDLAIKLDFYKEISALARKDTLIATNTSGLSINKLAEAVQGPQRFLGMHWFNPPTLIPLIEIIKNDKTSPETAQAIYDLALAIQKKPAVVREVCHMVEQGVVSAEAADAVMKYGLGFRWACLGPLETMDFGGLDIFAGVSSYLMPDLADGHEVPTILKEKVDRGDLGVKTGKGFYDYSSGRGEAAKKERDKKLQAVFQALYAANKAN